jgi:hypothetical protein
MLFAALLLVAFSNASFTRELVAEGNTHSALGNFRIEKADNPITINGEELKAFIISYQYSPMEVTVAIRKDKTCKSYFVLSDKLSIKYVCNANYFGVEMLDNIVEKGKYSTALSDLNMNEYFHQKVLAPGKRGEVENTGLIATYFPMLIKNA